MLTGLKTALKDPVKKPPNWKPYSEESLVGKQPGTLHTRYDCDYESETIGFHLFWLLVETFTFTMLGFAEIFLSVVQWFADLAPTLIKYSAVTVVGLALALAIAIAGISIGLGMSADLSYTELRNVIILILKGGA